MTTDRRQHSRAPLRRSTAPQKILATGLATATCVGLVGVIGARTVAANAQKEQKQAAATPTSAPVLMAQTVPVTSTGLTQADLDAYATSLAAQREKLDAYRDKLIALAGKLQRQAARQTGGAVTAARPAAPSVIRPAARPQSQPAAKPVSRPAARPAAPAAPAAPRPVAQPAPKPVPAPAPQSNTKTS